MVLSSGLRAPDHRHHRLPPPRHPPHPPTAALYSSEGYNMEDPVVVLSFGDVGQTVANMLSSPALGRPLPYVVFDLTVARVQAAQEAGFNVLYGDGGRPKARRARLRTLAGAAVPAGPACGWSGEGGATAVGLGVQRHCIRQEKLPLARRAGPARRGHRAAARDCGVLHRAPALGAGGGVAAPGGQGGRCPRLSVGRGCA